MTPKTIIQQQLDTWVGDAQMEVAVVYDVADGLIQAAWAFVAA